MPQALIVFAKMPEPGRVKTRLVPPLSHEEAARLYAAFLADALVQYATLVADVRLYLAPPLPTTRPGFVPPEVSLHAQQGDGLGARMKRAFVETFAAGYDRAVVIGTDHPTLPTAFITAAFEALAVPRAVCLGPSDDGGYYLLGTNDFFPQLFDGMRYSHDRVFAQTLDRAAATDAALTILPPWYDVDDAASLRRLLGDLDDGAIPVPHTRRVLASLLAAHPALRG